MPKIIVLRHAEKNNYDTDLSYKGYSRAYGLVDLLKTFKVDHIFASHNTKHSSRPLETISPFAESVDKKVNTRFADEEFKKLAKHLTKKKFKDSVVVICWHHGKIPKLVEALGAELSFKKWPEDVFDLLIEIEDGKAFESPQKLLYGDSDQSL